MDNLYPFQRTGVDFLIQTQGKAILADDMGLGKTVQTLTYLQEADPWRTLIVCPASVIYNWKAEADRWVGWNTQVMTTSKEPIPVARILIMSYNIMNRVQERLTSVRFECVVFDEAHYLKNENAQRTKAGMVQAFSSPSRIFLSGTPFKSRPAELYNLLHMTDPEEWDDRWAYWKRYCDLQHRWVGGRNVLDRSGASNIPELSRRIKPYMLRRTKQEVLDELPDLTRQVLPVEIDRTGYNQAWTELVEALARGQSRAWHLTKLNRLRQEVGKAKAKPAIAVAKDLLDSSDEKLVLFAYHLSVVETLREALAPYGVTTITGSVSNEERQTRVTHFQEQDNPRVMILTQAGSEGINLFRASNLIFVERVWTPAGEEQIEGRLHRIGQKSAVNAIYLVARGTVDTRIAQLIDQKRELFRTTMGDTGHIPTILLEELKDGHTNY